jgi:hypothetical protein
LAHATECEWEQRKRREAASQGRLRTLTQSPVINPRAAHGWRLQCPTGADLGRIYCIYGCDSYQARADSDLVQISATGRRRSSSCGSVFCCTA